MLEEIQNRLDTEPFVPFRIVVTSGDRFDVTNPNALTIAQSVLYLMDLRSERYTVIRTNQLCYVELLG